MSSTSCALCRTTLDRAANCDPVRRSIGTCFTSCRSFPLVLFGLLCFVSVHRDDAIFKRESKAMGVSEQERLWPNGYRTWLSRKGQRFDFRQQRYFFVISVMSLSGKFENHVSYLRLECSTHRTFYVDCSRCTRVYKRGSARRVRVIVAQAFDPAVMS